MNEKVILILTITLLLWLTRENLYGQSELNYKHGVFAAMIFISIVGSLRPSNPFGSYAWLFRFQFWLAVSYNAILVFLAFQNEQDARKVPIIQMKLMTLGDSSVGIPVVKSMHTYDDNCELEWANIVDNLDHYYLSHVIDWLFMVFLMRDMLYLNVWSIFDEIVELSWQHKIPHFRECWWDHVILDVLVGNTVSIIIGMWILRKLGLQEYDWFGRKGKKSLWDWEIWRKDDLIWAFLVSFTVRGMIFVNGFLLMNQLWVPPKVWMVSYRLLIWFALGHLAFRELHNSLTNGGEAFQVRFVTYFNVCLEAWIAYKFLKDCGNLQDDPTPAYKWVPWSLFYGALIVRYLSLRGRTK